MSSLKNPTFLLTLILVAFLAREVFLAGAFPLFTGQDEARHYNSVQWISEDQTMRCLQSESEKNIQDKEDLATYRFSEEIRETSATASLSPWREENYRKTTYISGLQGPSESTIHSRPWSRSNPICPPDIVPAAHTFSFFHWILSGIEHVFEKSDILTRFYLARILTVLFGAATILFTYLAAKEANLSVRASLLLALIISLQPRLSIYTTNINYDTLLIPFFSFFIWAGLRYLRYGVTPSTIFLLVLALVGAILTKGTGLVLLGGLSFLVAWTLWQKRSFWKQAPPYYWVAGAALVLILCLLVHYFYPPSRLLPQFSFPSFIEYISKSFPRIPSSSENFWGVISWNAFTWGPWFVYAIWIIEAVALIGLFRFFSSKENSPFLPAKSAALFFIIVILSLQIGIRFFDWRVFQETGSLALGTPGRYFLPTLLAQLLLVAVGFGALLKKKIYLEQMLTALALLMLAFYLYTLWLIVIPRFYL